MRKNILYVDDEEDLCELAKLNLSTDDFFITTITDPDRVMEAIERYKPSLVLLDILMPKRGGLWAGNSPTENGWIMNDL